VLSALYNVKINLASIKDASFIKDVGKEVTHMESEIVKREKDLLSYVSI